MNITNITNNIYPYPIIPPVPTIPPAPTIPSVPTIPTIPNTPYLQYTPNIAYINNQENNTLVENTETVGESDISLLANTLLAKTVCGDIIYKNRGWYNRSKNIIKFLHNNIARCFECYNMVNYNEMQYSRILGFDKTELNNINCISCICKSCCHIINTSSEGNIRIPKVAPKKYSDILSDYILNDHLDLIVIDIEHCHKFKMDIVEDKINYLLFNLNEKKVILNNLTNENNKLSNNLELEIAKFKILNEQYIQNKIICDNIKTQLMQFSIDLFKENRKQIDCHINKYNELNNTSKYSIPECKICMMKEVKVAIQCGHVFCMGCYDELLKTNTANITANEIIDGNYVNNVNNNISVISCPICRTISCTYTQLFF